MIKVLLKRRIIDSKQGGAVTPCKAKNPLTLLLHPRDKVAVVLERKKKNRLRKNKATP